MEEIVNDITKKRVKDMANNKEVIGMLPNGNCRKEFEDAWERDNEEN